MNTMPGLDILQQWMQSARGAMPGLPAWAAPTLDPEEIGKRIEELRTVQFWLEQNAKLIAGSIQALEVQRMTLTTLQSLKVPLADIGAAFRVPEPAAAMAPDPNPAAEPAPEPAPAAAEPVEPASGEAPAAAAGARSPLADPMQWWGTLTQQFAHLATQAAQESAAAAQAAAAAASSTVARAVAPQPAPTADAPAPARTARTARAPAKKAGPATPARKSVKAGSAAPTARRKTAAAPGTPATPKGRR